MSAMLVHWHILVTGSMICVVRVLSDSLSVQFQEDGQPSESESRGIGEHLPQIKEEPKLQNIQMEEEARDSEEGSCSRLNLLREPHPAQTVCSTQCVSLPLLISQEMKAERAQEESSKQLPASNLPSSITVSSNCRAFQSTLCATTVKSHRLHTVEEQVKGSLHSNEKPNAHLLQIKNIRTLKLPLPRSSHQSQSIQRWHSCIECGKGFSFACQLEVHRRWHTKEKPYSCTVCRKSFTTVSMLKRHHRIHTGEKPFRCHVCGKCFNQSAHLNTHLRLHTRERSSWSRAPHSK